MEIFYMVVVGALLAGVFFLYRQHLNVTAFLAFSVGGLLLSLMVHPVWVMVERNNKETFHEFWNGVEVAALAERVVCERDGNCRNTYDCDPYTVTRVEYYTDSDGNQQSRVVTETKYHSCPYSSEETTYSVDTTLGNFVIQRSAMTGDRFRAGTNIPGGRVTSPPAAWSAADERVKAGVPGGVSQQQKYKNFILGSDKTIFSKFTHEISELDEAGLLPARNVEVFDTYLVDKVHFVGVDEKLVGESLRQGLQEDLRRLNAYAGSELAADVNVVVVDAGTVAGSDMYTDTLHAYWLSPEFGRDRLAKNTVNIVVGVEAFKEADATDGDADVTADDGDAVSSSDEVSESVEGDASGEVTVAPGEPVVAWARAFTGMPLGNEALIQDFRTALDGKPVDGSFIGSPVYDVESGEFVSDTPGALESVLFGVHKFERVSMSGGDADDVGSGFAYLSGDYELDTGSYVWVHVIASVFILMGAVGGVFAAGRFADSADVVTGGVDWVGSKLKK